MPTLAFTLIGHNESEPLRRALESVSWADEIVYVDCDSMDDSLEVAKDFTSKVFSQPNNKNININKAYGIDQAKTDWVFYMDPDEEISEALALEIRQMIKADPVENAFALPRKNHHFGRWLRHGRQYPDTQLRLFRRGKARFPCVDNHEKLQVEGTVGQLKEALTHYAVESPTGALKKLNFHSSEHAWVLYEKGRQAGPGLFVLHVFLKPPARFFRRYLLKLGFLDGMPGLINAFLGGIEPAIIFFKLWYWQTDPKNLPKKPDHG